MMPQNHAIREFIIHAARKMIGVVAGNLLEAQTLNSVSHRLLTERLTVALYM